MASQSTTRYTEQGLREQFKYLKDAKEHFGLKARGWQALAEKLNEPSKDDLRKQVQLLTKKVEALETENQKLRSSVVQGEDFDEMGFWLLDRNFDRSNFEDFDIDEEATEVESKAKSEHQRLAKLYHPDNGGTAEQMANVNRLKEQMLALVKMNGGMGL